MTHAEYEWLTCSMSYPTKLSILRENLNIIWSIMLRPYSPCRTSWDISAASCYMLLLQRETRIKSTCWFQDISLVESPALYEQYIIRLVSSRCNFTTSRSGLLSNRGCISLAVICCCGTNNQRWLSQQTAVKILPCLFFPSRWHNSPRLYPLRHTSSTSFSASAKLVPNSAPCICYLLLASCRDSKNISVVGSLDIFTVLCCINPVKFKGLLGHQVFWGSKERAKDKQ